MVKVIQFPPKGTQPPSDIVVVTGEARCTICSLRWLVTKFQMTDAGRHTIECPICNPG